MKMARKAFWWVLATVVAVPITKWVESQSNLSFFSPAITGLWNWMMNIGSWLNQAVPMPLWTLIGITLVALLMAGAFLWAVLDANKQLNAADANLDAANAKIASLLNPRLITLNDDQLTVLSVIATEPDGEAWISTLSESAKLHRLRAEGALDVLISKGLVAPYSTSFGDKVGLTADGRKYILHPTSPIGWIVKDHS